jgi:hypothetical protein
MIERTFDVFSVEDAISSYDDIDVDVGAWLGDGDNVALTNDIGDIALFERNYLGIYTGHYFFRSKGKTARANAKEFLHEIFTEYPVDVIRGMTPLENLGARWMNKQLGFTGYGVLETSEGPCELVILTKQEWEQLSG